MLRYIPYSNAANQTSDVASVNALELCRLAGLQDIPIINGLLLIIWIKIIFWIPFHSIVNFSTFILFGSF